jgi:hypothetical protein
LVVREFFLGLHGRVDKNTMDGHNRTIVRQALARLDARGRFSSEDGPRLHQVADDLRAGPIVIDHPADLFGPWGELTPNARTAFRRVVEKEIVDTMSFFPRGELWNGVIRGGWEVDRYLAENRVHPWARRPLIAFTNRLTAGPMNLRNRLMRKARWRTWQRGRDLTLEALLVALGRGPSWLLGDFVQGVEVDPRARGYYLDAARNVVFGYHVGMDLMPTAEGMICLETNLQIGIGDYRLPVQPENPVADGVLEAALDLRARRVLWLEGHRAPLPHWMMQELTERGRALGIQVEFLEDPRVGRRRTAPRESGVPNRASWVGWVPDDTLVMRRNEFPVGPDFVINDKEPSIRALHAVLTETGETRVKVLPQTRVPADPLESAGEGLPNLVYKYPDSMSGLGVYFMKVGESSRAVALARELDRRTGEKPGLFQRFVLSDLMPGGRVFDYRAEILLTPPGVWFLGAFRREASLPHPDRVPDGIVDAPGALTSNYSRGGILSRVEGDDLQRVEEAALAVGNALRTALSRTFRTESGRPHDPVPR